MSKLYYVPYITDSISFLQGKYPGMDGFNQEVPFCSSPKEAELWLREAISNGTIQVENKSFDVLRLPPVEMVYTVEVSDEMDAQLQKLKLKTHGHARYESAHIPITNGTIVEIQTTIDSDYLHSCKSNQTRVEKDTYAQDIALAPEAYELLQRVCALRDVYLSNQNTRVHASASPSTIAPAVQYRYAMNFHESMRRMFAVDMRNAEPAGSSHASGLIQNQIKAQMRESMGSSTMLFAGRFEVAYQDKYNDLIATDAYISGELTDAEAHQAAIKYALDDFYTMTEVSIRAIEDTWTLERIQQVLDFERNIGLYDEGPVRAETIVGVLRENVNIAMPYMGIIHEFMQKSDAMLACDIREDGKQLLADITQNFMDMAIQANHQAGIAAAHDLLKKLAGPETPTTDVSDSLDELDTDEEIIE